MFVANTSAGNINFVYDYVESKHGEIDRPKNIQS